MKITVNQFQPVFGEKELNRKKMLEMTDQSDSDLYLFPELSFSGYCFDDVQQAEGLSNSMDSDFFDPFLEKSKEKNAAIMFGFSEKTEEGLYNSAAFIHSGKIAAVYRKTHLFFHEKEFFLPGNSGFKVVDFNNVRIGLAVCFDWFYPESFRTLTMMGAQVIAHVSNLVMPYCQRADYARAVENRVFVFTVNRTGSEKNKNGQTVFTGQSVGVTPDGEYLFQASDTGEEIFTVDIDPKKADCKDLNPMNSVFEDRRPEMYHPDLSKTQS